MSEPLVNPEATPGHNADRLKAFFEDVDALGAQSGLGASALPKLGLRVIEAAHDGLIQPQDAKSIYERYVAAHSNNSTHTKGGAKANASKLRKLIELGCLPDGAKLAEDAVHIREEIPKAKPLFEGLVGVARLRLKGAPPSHKDVTEALAKAVPKPKSAEKEWSAVAKRVEELVAMKDKAGMETAIAIRDRVNEYVEANTGERPGCRIDEIEGQY